jgi:glucosamine-6-phosphate deaminase
MTLPVVSLPADDWAERVAADLAARLRAEPGLRLCLPTGETPAPLYAALVAAAERGDVSLEQASILLLDEYVGLPPGDPARCDTQLRRQLLDRLPHPPATVHLVDPDPADPGAAVARHDAVAAAGLDLVLLGLGTNGHVGLNEPGSTASSPTRVVALAPSSRAASVDRYGASEAPEHGLTLGMDRLLESGEIWLLVTGEHKAGILERALNDVETPDIPATYLRRHPRLRVLADEAATARLMGPRAAPASAQQGIPF